MEVKIGVNLRNTNQKINVIKILLDDIILAADKKKKQTKKFKTINNQLNEIKKLYSQTCRKLHAMLKIRL